MSNIKIYYEDRTSIQVTILELIEKEFLKHGIIISEDDKEDIMGFTDDVFEKYTNGQYKSYKF